MTASRTAVVLLVRDPRLEAASKRIMGRRSASVHAALLAEASVRLRIPGTELILAWQGDADKAWKLKPRAVVAQRGRSFGQRIGNAALDTAALGYDRLVMVGVDAPDMNAAVVGRACRDLEWHDVVLAPASDGGVNLLAFDADKIERITFKPLPWLTAALFAAFERSLAKADLRVSVLPVSEDLDTTEALERRMNKEPHSLLTRLVERALGPEQQPLLLNHSDARGRLGSPEEPTKTDV